MSGKVVHQKATSLWMTVISRYLGLISCNKKGGKAVTVLTQDKRIKARGASLTFSWRLKKQPAFVDTVFVESIKVYLFCFVCYSNQSTFAEP